MICAIFLFAVWDLKEFPTNVWAYVVGAWMIAYGFWLDRRRYIDFDGGEVVSSGYHMFGKDRANVDEVTEIRRVRTSRLGSGGGAIAFYGKDGFLIVIREYGYSVDTIEAFLRDLVSRKEVVLDPQYQDLIAGKLKGVNRLSSLPATHSGY